jgi:RNA recognition motif. (a.k.a. RRM, RBD, or RNP domain)
MCTGGGSTCLHLVLIKLFFNGILRSHKSMSDLEDFYAEIAEAECLVENQVDDVSETARNELESKNPGDDEQSRVSSLSGDHSHDAGTSSVLIRKEAQVASVSRVNDTKFQSSTIISKQASESVISAPAVLSANTSYRPPLLGAAPVIVAAAVSHVESTSVPVIPAPSASTLNTKRPATVGETSTSSKKSHPHKRACAGEVWVDPTLDEWPENDFRMFVGNLGNEVTDEMLSEPFLHMKSFVKARVVREPKTKKSKGYGFLSFLEPGDALTVLNSYNGKYIGNRPISIKRASNDKEFDKSKFKKPKHV